MPADFGHLVLTRFSVRFGHDQPAPEEDWLTYRWAFFRDAAASSLAHQSVKNSRWLVFFDASTPNWLRAEIEVLRPGLSEPVFLDEPWSYSVLQRAVEELIQAPCLITTRLDSDDAVAVRFIEQIQADLGHQYGQYINLMHGVWVERSGQLFRFDYLENPFISCVEKRAESHPPRTVFQSFQHGASRKHASIINVVTPDPMWMQVIHGSNLMNEVRGIRTPPARSQVLSTWPSLLTFRYRDEPCSNNRPEARFGWLGPG